MTMSDFNRDELRRALRDTADHRRDGLGPIVEATRGLNFTRSLSRRRFFIAGGATVSFAALVAACGGSESAGIARLGDAPTPNKLVEADVTDIALLRTATSLEHNAIFVYEAVARAGVLSGDAAEIAKRFLDDHRSHAEATASLTTALGGTAYSKPNPRLQSIYIDPALTLILGDEETGVPAADDPAADVLALAYALETIAGATYQAYVPLLDDKSLRAAAMGIGDQEARHAALLGVVLNPGRLVSSMGLPIAAEYQEDTDSPAAAYASPSAFGTQAPVPVTLGASGETGTRTTVNLETPSLNSMIYEYLDNEG